MAAVSLALALVAAGCTSEPEEPQVAPTVTVPAVVVAAKAAPPQPVVPVVWPLTGQPTAEVAARPALAIKIENSSQSRPQTGLEHADIVWEEVVEGGITRFVAVYHSQVPAAVEPVRSVRPMDPAIVAPMRPILAYSGAQQQYIDAVGAAGIQSVIMDLGHAGFRRDRSRRAPHNVIGDPAAFWAQADGARAVPPPAQFAYGRAAGKSTAATVGGPGGRLDVTMSRAHRSLWEWDGTAYVRSEGSRASVSTSGARHAATNLVLLSVEVVNTPFRDPSGAPVPETQLIGSGEGVVAALGKSVPVLWSKAALDAPIVLTLADGTPVKLEQGNTWVELVPRGSGSWAIS
ncbi:DUF3048 domain-containing protein [Antribacter gilvus]|uniref:DUF3048 domain-containing protein n=1 Tax=Antribacter gilvus TaxID=2304675 RepID=UPI000F7AC9DF|nr:DUF3048 domain-containing protein [Antribacter gilvus]